MIDNMRWNSPALEVVLNGDDLSSDLLLFSVRHGSLKVGNYWIYFRHTKEPYAHVYIH